MSHDHVLPEHGHDAGQRRLGIVFAMASTYALVELAGGYWTGSLALLADAFHLFSDVAALGLALFAAHMSQRPATAQRTFGHSRAEILAALANGVALAAIALFIAVSALERLGQPREVHGPGMIVFALGALAYELTSLWILSRGRTQNLNVRGAFLHVASDALGSLGAILAGAGIWAFGWLWADSVASVAIGALILHASWALIRDALDVLMETAPAHLDVAEIHRALADLRESQSVHDLHVWSIGSGEVSLSCHVVTSRGSDPGKVLRSIRELLRERFGIQHTTVQLEAVEDGDGSDEAGCEGACEPAPGLGLS